MTFHIPSPELEWRPIPVAACKSGLSPPDTPIETWNRITDLLEDRRLEQTLRCIDVMNGCCNQCDTCLSDSPLPTKQMSLASVERLFADERFIRILQPDSLRFGSFGDITDHPECMKILRIALSATNSVIKIFTNYRRHKEALIEEILALTAESPRVMVNVSLPLNRDESTNESFISFAARRPDFFVHREGGPKVAVWDVRHPKWLLMVGRVLGREHLKSRIPPEVQRPRFRELELEQRGYGKVYLNAEGLWLMMYVTGYESHTSRLFAPLTPATIDQLSRVPYHPDFPLPPYWPGGQGERRLLSDEEVAAEEMCYKAEGKRLKRRTVVN